MIWLRFFILNRFLYKTVQLNYRKSYKNNKIIILLVFVYGFLSLPSYSAIINATTDGGFFPAGSINGSIKVSSGVNLSNNSLYLLSAYGIGFNSLAPSSICNYVNSWKTIDGYYGFQVRPGIILVIYNTSITGQVVSTFGGAIAINTSYDALGFPSNTPPSKSEASCFAYTNSGVTTTSLTTMTISGKYGYYIQKGVVEQTINSSGLAFRRGGGVGSTAGDYVTINKNDTINITKALTSCSILTPSTIDFNTIDITASQDSDILGVQHGALSVSCTGDAPSVAVTVTGLPGRYKNTLRVNMSIDGSIGPAEIRGQIGPEVTNIGNCTDSDSLPGSIIFDSALSQPINVGSLVEGTNSIPYVFSLCANGQKKFGQAQTSSIINLTWD